MIYIVDMLMYILHAPTMIYLYIGLNKTSRLTVAAAQAVIG